MPSPDQHGRFQAQLGLRDAGLLTETEKAALAVHLDTCAPCREAAEAYADGQEPAEARGGHIPSAMLARWDQVQTSAAGLERELLGRHLASCASCREDLELAGYEAVLRGEAENSRPEVDDDEDLSRSARVLTLTPRLRRRAWIQGALTGVVLTAAAAAIMLRPSSTSFDSGTLPWVVPGTTRGSAPAVEVSAGAQQVLLAIPTPTGLTPDSGVRLSVRGPDGSVLLDQDLAPELLDSPNIMVVLATTDPLEPGIYMVRIAPEGGGDPHTSSFQIRVSSP